MCARVCACVCVCVRECVCEQEREREREGDSFNVAGCEQGDYDINIMFFFILIQKGIAKRFGVREKHLRGFTTHDLLVLELGRLRSDRIFWIFPQ